MQLVRAVSALTLLQTPSLLAFPRIPASRIASPPRRSELGPSGGSRCGRQAPFVIPAAFSPAAGAAADPEVISMHSALVWGAGGGGRAARQRKQTNSGGRGRLRIRRDARTPLQTGGGAGPAPGGKKPPRIPFFFVVHHFHGSRGSSRLEMPLGPVEPSPRPGG